MARRSWRKTTIQGNSGLVWAGVKLSRFISPSRDSAVLLDRQWCLIFLTSMSIIHSSIFSYIPEELAPPKKIKGGLGLRNLLSRGLCSCPLRVAWNQACVCAHGSFIIMVRFWCPGCGRSNRLPVCICYELTRIQITVVVYSHLWSQLIPKLSGIIKTGSNYLFWSFSWPGRPVCSYDLCETYLYTVGIIFVRLLSFSIRVNFEYLIANWAEQ